MADELTIQIKLTGGKPFEIKADSTYTVLKVKEICAEQCSIPVEQQRLVYKGRMLKDHEKLSEHKVQSGNVMHLVKSMQPPANPQAATPQSTQQTPNPTPAATVPPQNPTGQQGNAGVSIPPIFGGFPGLAGAFGNQQGGGFDQTDANAGIFRNLEDFLSTPGLQRMVNEITSDPEVLNQILESRPLLNAFQAQMGVPNTGVPNTGVPNTGVSNTGINNTSGMPASGNNTAGANAGGVGTPVGQNQMPMLTPDLYRIGLQTWRLMAENQANTNNLASANNTNAAAGGNATFPGLGLPVGTSQGMSTQQAATQPSPVNNAGDGVRQNPLNASATNPLASFIEAFGRDQDFNQQLQNVQAMIAQNPQLLRLGSEMAAQAFNPDGSLRQDIAGMLGNRLGGFGFPGMPVPDSRPPEERYASQLRALMEMGFIDSAANVQALQECGGDVNAAITRLLERGVGN